jgi:hypothetical protein
MCYRLNVDKPSFKIGTLDQLMELNEELGKHDSAIEALAKRCEQSWYTY